MDYRARYYDARLGRFVSADTVVPGLGESKVQPGPQDWDRYSYVKNNPLISSDPTGHRECDLDCQAQNYIVDEHELYFGASYSGSCWGSQECIGPKAIGVRVENSVWSVAGFDFNFDAVYFFQSNQFAVFTTPGYQRGIGGGKGLSGGLIFSDNMPGPSSYEGFSQTYGGATPFPPINIEVENSVSLPNPDGSVPTTTYVGFAPFHLEAGAYEVTGQTYQVRVQDIVSWAKNQVQSVTSGLSGLFH